LHATCPPTPFLVLAGDAPPSGRHRGALGGAKRDCPQEFFPSGSPPPVPLGAPKKFSRPRAPPQKQTGHAAHKRSPPLSSTLQARSLAGGSNGGFAPFPRHHPVGAPWKQVPRRRPGVGGAFRFLAPPPEIPLALARTRPPRSANPPPWGARRRFATKKIPEPCPHGEPRPLPITWGMTWFPPRPGAGNGGFLLSVPPPRSPAKRPAGRTRSPSSLQVW